MARRKKHLGITIDSTGIRYARMRKKKGWEMERSGHLSFPAGLIQEDNIINEESLRITIQEWVKQERLGGATATLAVPTGQVIARKMTIPTTNEKELRQMIGLEVETTLHLPFEDPVYDYVQTGVDPENTHVLVFAAPRKWIETCVQILKESRIRVTSVEINAIALARSVYPQREEQLTETMLVYLTDSLMEISMFHEGNPVFIRSMVLEEEGYGSEVQSDAQMAGLSAEISRMLNFYQFGIHEGNSRITSAVITGTGERKLKLIRALRQSQPEISINGTEEIAEPEQTQGVREAAAAIELRGTRESQETEEASEIGEARETLESLVSQVTAVTEEINEVAATVENLVTLEIGGTIIPSRSSKHAKTSKPSKVSGPVKEPKPAKASKAQKVPKAAKAPKPSRTSSGQLEQNEEYMIPAGLAIQNEAFLNLNLLPKVDREKKLLPVLLAAGLAVWILGLGAVGYTYIEDKNVLAERGRQLAELQEQSLKLQSLIQENTASSKNNPTGTIDALLADRSDVVFYIRSLEEKLPAGATLRTINYASSGQITLNVVLKSLEDTSNFLLDIKRLPFVRVAQLGSITAQPTNTEVLPDGSIRITGGGNYIADYTIETSVKETNASNASQTSQEDSTTGEGK